MPRLVNLHQILFEAPVEKWLKHSRQSEYQQEGALMLFAWGRKLQDLWVLTACSLPIKMIVLNWNCFQKKPWFLSKYLKPMRIGHRCEQHFDHLHLYFDTLFVNFYRFYLRKFKDNRYRRGLETWPQAKTSKSGHCILFYFFRRVRATSMTQHQVENTRVHFWTFLLVSDKDLNKQIVALCDQIEKFVALAFIAVMRGCSFPSSNASNSSFRLGTFFPISGST